MTELDPDVTGPNHQLPDELVIIPDEGLERPFFDPDNLPDIAAIDLTPVRIKTKDYRGDGDSSFDATASVRYLLEAAGGTMADTEFTPMMEVVVGKVLSEQLQPERISDMYDLLEEVSPRIIGLMERVRSSGILAQDQYTTINKMVIFGSVLRLEHSS